MDVDVVSAQQIKVAQQFDQADRKNETLVHVLKQACSRNKAIEKKELWDERHRQDHGSSSCISLKSNDGDFHALAKIPAGAEVTLNSINKYDEERRRFAAHKEDNQLDRFCDGQDTAWRPDSYFTEVCSQEKVPPWPIRPTELFTNPHITFRIRAAQFEKRKAKKAAKRLEKEMMKESKGELQGEGGLAEEGNEDEGSVKRKKKEKDKDRKKDKKDKKAKKNKKGKKEKKAKDRAKKKKEKKKEKKESDTAKEKKEKKAKKDEKKERDGHDRREKDKHEGKQRGNKQQGEEKAEAREHTDKDTARDYSKLEKGKATGKEPPILKPNKGSAKESRKRSREKSSASEQAEDKEQSSSPGGSSDDDKEEKESSVHEVESTSEANWECSDSGEEGA
mmetsp:Transcript_24326/g.32838  ORF Transcript_24326/g.32838 Transcript_24326/m.32838 type:complete len:392 (-) Transcript_24326:218-1393(-)